MMGRGVSTEGWLRGFLIAAAVCGLGGGAGAQVGGGPVDAKLPMYDVVSIKPDKAGTGNIGIEGSSGRFEATNITMRDLIVNAYDLKTGQLIGLPPWGDSEHFDLKAKVVEADKKALDAMSPEQERLMLAPILTERFQLKFHFEKKVLSVYELVVVKSGAKFKDTEAIGDKTVYGMGPGSMSIHNHELTAAGVSMDQLARSLSGMTQRIVVDKTGLAGKYDLKLTWSRDDGAAAADDAGVGPPPLFTAVQEQLGLKLQPGKAEVDTFVVDSAVLPTFD